MRILIVGAGGIGGYFGGRLLQAGRDVTFLVRPRRAAQLAKTGLVIRSSLGDYEHRAPPMVTADGLRGGFDLVLLSCKAYDLDDAMESFAPAVGPGTAILPVLNGMRHVDALAARFGAEHVLGGLCMIAAALDVEGRVLHLNETHTLAFGEQDGKRTTRMDAIVAALSRARFDAQPSDTIVHEMWEKWAFIAALAGITCLMRATIGEIVAAGAADLAIAMLDETAGIATAHGFAPSDASMQRSRTMFTTPGSGLSASMFRDIESGGRIEGEHIVGELLRRGERNDLASPLLRIAYAHLKAYEARRG